MRKKCINCGEMGHIYRNCKCPLSSYGVIIYRRRDDTDEHEYLMIQRRHTFGYVEIMRGNYDESDETYLGKLFAEMTRTERKNIFHVGFEELWNDLWLQTAEECSRYSKDFKKSKQKFEACQEILKRVDENVPFLWEIPEWGFPKGKKNMNENLVACAVRECFEETNIPMESYRIIQELSPLEETFRGTDDKIYRHLYLIAELINNNVTLEIKEANILQKREVGCMRWFSLTEALNNIRPYNREKRELIEYVDQNLPPVVLFPGGTGAAEVI